jgi:hypothetical protein
MANIALYNSLDAKRRIHKQYIDKNKRNIFFLLKTGRL